MKSNCLHIVLTLSIGVLIVSSCNKDINPQMPYDTTIVNPLESITGHTWLSVLHDTDENGDYYNSQCLILDLAGNKLLAYDMEEDSWDDAIVDEYPVKVEKYDKTTGEGRISISHPSLHALDFICDQDTLFSWFSNFSGKLQYDTLQIFNKADGLMDDIAEEIKECEEFGYLDIYGNDYGLHAGDHAIDWDVPELSYLNETGTKAGSLTLTGILEKSAGSIANDLVGKGFSALMNELIGDKKSAPVYAAPMEELGKGLSDINTSIKNLCGLEQNKILSAALERYNANLLTMGDNLTRFISNIEKAYAAKDTAKVKEYLKEWGENKDCSFENGVSFKNSVALSRFIEYTMTKSVAYDNQSTLSGMFKIFDAMVYNSCAWEHQGYKQRTVFREREKALIIKLYSIQALWIWAAKETDEYARKTEFEMMEKSMKQYVQYINDKAQQVEVHNDVSICQIAKAHVWMSRRAIGANYKDHIWLKGGGTLCVASIKKKNLHNKKPVDFVYGFDEGNKKRPASMTRASCLKQSEVKAILDWYGNKRSIHDIIAKDALVRIDPNKYKTMVLSDACSLSNSTYNTVDINVSAIQGELKYDAVTMNRIGTMGLKASAFRNILPFSALIHDSEYRISQWKSFSMENAYAVSVTRY